MKNFGLVPIFILATHCTGYNQQLRDARSESTRDDVQQRRMGRLSAEALNRMEETGLINEGRVCYTIKKLPDNKKAAIRICADRAWQGSFLIRFR